MFDTMMNGMIFVYIFLMVIWARITWSVLKIKSNMKQSGQHSPNSVQRKSGMIERCAIYYIEHPISYWSLHCFNFCVLCVFLALYFGEWVVYLVPVAVFLFFSVRNSSAKKHKQKLHKSSIVEQLAAIGSGMAAYYGEHPILCWAFFVLSWYELYSIMRTFFDDGPAIIIALVPIVAYLLPVAVCNLIISEKKQNQEMLEKILKEFEKLGIQGEMTEYQRKKAQLIVERMGLSSAKTEELYQQALASRAQQQADAHEKMLYETRRQEEKQKLELERFAQCYGRQKRVAMLEAQQAAYRKRANELRKDSSDIYHATQSTELNSGIMGGIASGLAGPVAGISAALDAESRNQEVRAQNKANATAWSPVMLNLHCQAGDLDKKADDLQKEVDDAKIKLVSDLREEDIFSRLSVRHQGAEVTKTGAVILRAEVALGEPEDFWMIDQQKGVVDGYLRATVCQHGKKLGEALLPLPLEGIADRSEIYGITLADGDPQKECEVAYEPYTLWVMEATE